MKAWKWAALVAALVAAGGLGAAFAPPALGQSDRATRPARWRSSRDAAVRSVCPSATSKRTMRRPGSCRDRRRGVEDVAEDSPAAKAGFKKGDIVVEYDGERVRSVRQFTRLVQETPAGRKIQASLVRDGQRVNVTVEPRERSAFNVFDGGDVSVFRDFGRKRRRLCFCRYRRHRPHAVPPGRRAPDAADASRGAGVSGFSKLHLAVRQQPRHHGERSCPVSSPSTFGTKDGALVTSVYDDSAAAKAGIKAGDVITRFNGAEVIDPSDLRRRIQRLQNGDEFTVECRARQEAADAER